jgi:mutator protein MutT
VRNPQALSLAVSIAGVAGNEITARSLHGGIISSGGNRLVRVVAGLIEKKGRLLICQRRRGSLFEFQWEFPGGKLRSGERPQTGLARELREELGSRARIGDEIYRTRHYYQEHAQMVELIFFHVPALTPAPRNLVFEKMVWVSMPDLPRYDFLAADRELVARLATDGLRCERQPKEHSSPHSK